MAEDLRAVVDTAVGHFNDRADRRAFLESYSPDVVLHGYPQGMEGMDGLRRFHAALWDAFPDARIALEDTLIDGDRAALRYRLTGTHRLSYLGVEPTGLTIDVEGMMIVRVEDGRVAEEWHSATELRILHQLGAIEVHLDTDEREHVPRRSASAEAAALRWEEQHEDF
jgi:predicted ester cyclase